MLSATRKSRKSSCDAGSFSTARGTGGGGSNGRLEGEAEKDSDTRSFWGGEPGVPELRVRTKGHAWRTPERLS